MEISSKSKIIDFESFLIAESSAINIADVAARRDTAADPAIGCHLRHQVLRILDILLEGRDQGSVLLGEELLRDSAALLALTHLLRVEQQALHIRIATTSTHVRHSGEGSRLVADDTAIILELGLIAKNGVNINLLVVVAVPLLRIDQKLLSTERVYSTGIGDKIGRHIVARANGLTEI